MELPTRPQAQAELDTPTVSPFLVEHLRQAFPFPRPATMLHELNAYATQAAVARWQGIEEVIAYLDRLSSIPKGLTPNELPRTETADHTPRRDSRAPGPRS